jgi:hypothetical protein
MIVGFFEIGQALHFGAPIFKKYRAKNMKNRREGFLSIFQLFMSLKMETKHFSEIPVNLYNNAGRHDIA